MNSNNKSDIQREMPYSHLLHVLLPITFMLIWSLDSNILKISIGLNDFIPFKVRLILFAAILCSAIILMLLSHRALFNNNQPSDTLITGGILGYVRHPLYLAILLIYIAFLFLSISLISLGLFIILFLIYNKMANYEEKVLEKLFGDEYLEYKKKVSKWFPNPFK